MLVMVFVHVTLGQSEASWIARELISKIFLSLEKENSIMQRDIIFGSLCSGIETRMAPTE